MTEDASPTLRAPTPFELRAMLEDAVTRDLRGPAGGPDEEISEDTVRDRYLVGMLAPVHRKRIAQTLDGLGVERSGSSEDGPVDAGAALAEAMFPSSFGLTACTVPEADAITVTARWGRYTRVPSGTQADPKTGNPLRVWKREQVHAVSPPLPLRDGAIGPWVVTDEQPEVVVRGLARRRDGSWIVTLFLVNGQKEPDQLRDATWLFQPELQVAAPDGSPIFCARPPRRPQGRMDPAAYEEERSMAMLYRHQLEFAVGHGVAVRAEVSCDDPRRATRVETIVLPVHEVPQQTSPTAKDIPRLDSLVLDMAELSVGTGPELASKLAALPDAYADWIDRQRRRIERKADGLDELEPEARRAMDGWQRALSRIRDGIALIERDAVAAEAFRFANRAMALQRVRSILARETSQGNKLDVSSIDVPTNRSWFPFQLGFILMNLPGLTDLRHADRRMDAEAVADLLWFPTGGGKTEAYLGLAAYTMALRRLQGAVGERPGDQGVAVLMRYTLRLLTLQQFQRAATLVCACEWLRREALGRGEARLGTAPFRIGLWVGQRTTPNTTEQSAESVRQQHGHYRHAGAVGGIGSPAQLTHCPWCGTEIKPGTHIKVEPLSSGRGRTIIYCGDRLGHCPWSEAKSRGEGLPALVVDEEIYRQPPSLLIATVDKFAQMPWKGPVQTLFGQASGLCPRHGLRSPELEDADSHPKKGHLPAVRSQEQAPLRPPDLIIQDELHLISGPLGTLVGLYETAVDELASWDVDGHRVRPKVIASTATIRRARDQVHQLFLRRLGVFPPHGLDAGDNFFSIQRPVDGEFPGRRYLGICAPGRRLKATHIRVYVAFLAAAQQLYERYGVQADPWMTLAGYFNALRELGGMRRLVDDDIRARLRDTALRGLARRGPLIVEELTSRKGARDIPLVLARLEARFDPAIEARRAAAAKSGVELDIPRPPDVLLATNMISVGIDVKRLGLMVVAGQPKTTAEYIQATSRVGRSKPGLVCTVYNWARPRDLSHYESFGHYHATFYQHVEALSVTPFSLRALDRGLSALMVAIVRLANTDLNPNLAAEAITRSHPSLVRAIAAIEARARMVSGSRQTASTVSGLLARRVDLWLAQAQRVAAGRRLGYQDQGEVTVGLLRPAGREAWEEFTCLNSLRDVEPSIPLILDDRGLDVEDVVPPPPPAGGTS